MPILYGVPLGPYVRKTMLALAHKHVEYSLKPTGPGSDDAEFRESSPIGKIPAFKPDSGRGFSDSSVIVAYLERTSNINPLYPEDNGDFSQAMWLEEYADTKMSETTNALYFQRVVGPIFFKHVTDDERVEEILTKLLPPVLVYLETVVKADTWIFGDRLSIADLCIGSNLVSLMHANFNLDEGKWPKLAAFFARFVELDVVKKQLAVEKQALEG